MKDTYQDIVDEWMIACFGDNISMDKKERNFRFFEEAIELVQACGMTKEECLQLIDYTFNRPIGEQEQEVGGVLVTLAALCTANSINMEQAGISEAERVWNYIDQIRAKQQMKKIKSSPIP